MRSAVFLDRDGVINRTVWSAAEQAYDSPYRMEDFALLPGAAEAIRRINQMGLLAIVVSNQPGIAKGKCTPELLEEMTQEMHLALAAKAARLDAVYYCQHHPQAMLPQYHVVCDCRKPKPGLIRQAARELEIDTAASYMIGDQERDIEAGLQAGCSTVLVCSAGETPTASQMTASTLSEAVELLATRRSA